MVKSSASLAKSARSSIESMNVVDWLLAIGLIVVIVMLVVWIYTHRNGDGISNTMMEEGFYDRGERGRANRQEMIELFNGGAEKKGPETLTSLKQIDEMSDNEIIVLLIHHEDCIHCKNFRPMWTRLTEKYQHEKQGEKTIHLYDISNTDNEALWSASSDRFGVEGYPTILFLKRKGESVDHQEYMGPRDEYAIWCRYIERQCAE